MTDTNNRPNDIFDEIEGHLSWSKKRRPDDEHKNSNPALGLILGGDPDAVATIPSDEQFDVLGYEFMGSSELRIIGEGLIARHLDLGFMSSFSIGYLWRRVGPEKAGAPVWGTMAKPSGPLRFFSKHDFIVTLAANHCRTYGLTNLQIEALVFHELLHAGLNETGEKPKLRGHDLEMFHEEVNQYGLWRADLKRAQHTFEQVALVLQEDAG